MGEMRALMEQPPHVTIADVSNQTRERKLVSNDQNYVTDVHIKRLGGP